MGLGGEDEEMDSVAGRDGPQENGVQWSLGDEENDLFPYENGDSQPPAAPSNGQGGLTQDAQLALREKRKRLK